MAKVIGICVLAVCLAAVAGAPACEPPPAADAWPQVPSGFKQHILAEIEYGDGLSEIEIWPWSGEGELPAGPTRVFLDDKGRIYVYDSHHGTIKRFVREGDSPRAVRGYLDDRLNKTPGVFFVDTAGNFYSHRGPYRSDGSESDDPINIRKHRPSGEVIYDLGLWDAEAQPPGHALVLYKGGREKGQRRVFQLSALVPEGVDAESVHPGVPIYVMWGDFWVDPKGCFYIRITWDKGPGEYIGYVGQSIVRIGPAGDEARRVPSHVFDGKGNYFVGLNDVIGDARLESGLIERKLSIVDEKGSLVGTRVLHLPLEANGSQGEKKGILGDWYAAADGRFYCVESVAVGPEVKLGCGLVGHSEFRIHAFDARGELVGMGCILKPYFDVPFQPTVDPDGSIYFLNFRDNDVQVIKWEKMRD